MIFLLGYYKGQPQARWKKYAASIFTVFLAKTLWNLDLVYRNEYSELLCNNFIARSAVHVELIACLQCCSTRTIF